QDLSGFGGGAQEGVFDAGGAEADAGEVVGAQAGDEDRAVGAGGAAAGGRAVELEQGALEGLVARAEAAVEVAVVVDPGRDGPAGRQRVAGEDALARGGVVAEAGGDRQADRGAVARVPAAVQGPG